MGRWLKLGERTVSGPYQVELTRRFNLEDYPPGTSLPELPQPDLSSVNPVLRAWARRRMRKAQAIQQEWIERARDDYFRGEGINGDGPDAE